MSDNGTTALATRQAGGEIVNLKTAEMFVRSGMFPGIRDIAQAFVKIQAGAELGITPFAAMRGVHIIQGQATLGAHLMAAKIKSSGRYDYRILQQSEKVCEIEWYDQGKPIGKSQFTIAEAQAAGMLGKDNWRKYPSDMLYARCLSRGARRYAPDALNGAVYIPEELGVEVDATGAAVEPKVESADDLNAELEAVDAPKQLPQPADEPETRQPEPDTEGVEAEPPEIPTNITREFVMAECERCNADAKAVGAWVKLNAPKSKFDNLDADKRLALVDAIRGGDYAKGGE